MLNTFAQFFYQLVSAQITPLDLHSVWAGDENLLKGRICVPDSSNYTWCGRKGPHSIRFSRALEIRDYYQDGPG